MFGNGAGIGCDIQNNADSQGALSGSYRVIRGGGWGNRAKGCRVSRRFPPFPVYRQQPFGGSFYQDS